MLSYTFFWLLHLLSLVSYLHVSFAAIVPGYSTSLGITRNAITRTGPKVEFILYTGIVEYEEDVQQFSDEQLVGLVHQAWEEMKQEHQQWVDQCRGGQSLYVRDKRPFMMSAIALGKEIFFASSMTANGVNILLQNSNSELTQALNACRLNYYPNAEPVPNDMIHRTKGSCGEIMASALHLQLHQVLPWNANKIPTRVVAFGTDGETVQWPCSRKDVTDEGHPRISCLNWVKWQEMTIVKPGTEEEKVTVPPKKITNLSLQDAWTIKDTTEFVQQ